MLRWLVTDGEATVAVQCRDSGVAAVGGYARCRVAIAQVAAVVLGAEAVAGEPRRTQRNKIRWTGQVGVKETAVAMERLVDAGWLVTAVRSTGRVMK